METTTLNATQRSYMRDTRDFCKRMTERAEALWTEEYTVTAGTATGDFLVRSPKADLHTINLLAKTCTCPYQTKADVPQVDCKHLQGGEALITEQLAYWKMLANMAQRTAKPGNGGAGRAEGYWAQYHPLKAAWDAYEAARDECNWTAWEEEQDSRLFLEACAIDGDLRGNFGVEF